MAAVQIRKATDADIPRIVDMTEQFYATTGYSKVAPISEESVVRLAILTMDTGVLLVAEDAGEIVAMASIFVGPFLFNSALVLAHEIATWIEPEHRNGSLDERMLQAVDEACAAWGATFVRMAVMAGSSPQDGDVRAIKPSTIASDSPGHQVARLM